MKNDPKAIAEEQYELHADPVYQFNMNRRRFFQVMGSGLAIAFTIDATATDLTEEEKLPENQVGAWIHIGADGHVTIYSGKAEVGQNIRTSLAQIVAEELRVPIDRIEMILGDTDITPYDRGTFGSRSIPYMGPQLRKAAATAREVLIDMAAKQWKVDRSSVFIEDGEVKNWAKKLSAGIGTLTRGQELVEGIRDDVPVTPPERWKIAGTSVPKVNAASFLTGKHRYSSDMTLPGMMYGKVLRPPSYGAKLRSVNMDGASSMPGVVVVRDGDFIAVAAPDTHTANRAIAAVHATWEEQPQPGLDALFDHLKKTADNNNSNSEVRRAFDAAPIKVEQTFYVDYIAHAPLEPRAGLAQWNGEKLTVWTGTQRPFGVQEELAKAFSISKENIRVIHPDTGSGYGGKHTGEAAVEAARIARAAQRPVKVVWTREEEFTWAYFRPAGVIDVKGGATSDGTITAWEFHNYNSGGSGIETPYNVTHRDTRFFRSDSPLRQGSYRALASTANAFARESIMDDLASAVKMNPHAFRLKNLKEQRLINVLNAAVEIFGWHQYKPVRGRGIGLACGMEKGGFIATCVEVAVDSSSGDVKVLRAVAAFDCGAIINPKHLESQIAGAVLQGLGGALFEWVNFKDGKILNPRFSDYRVPRFADIPELEIAMLNRPDIPSAGAGEVPIIAIAPAIRNAIANATGKRLYTLPLLREKG